MPACTGSDDYRRQYFATCLDLGRGRVENILLNGLAFLVQFTQTQRDGLGGVAV